MHIELIGLFAAFCTTSSFVPQIRHIYRNKDTSSISLGMYIIYSIGVMMWVVYGVFLASPSLIIANAFTLVLALSILYMKLRWK